MTDDARDPIMDDADFAAMCEHMHEALKPVLFDELDELAAGDEVRAMMYPRACAAALCYLMLAMLKASDEAGGNQAELLPMAFSLVTAIYGDNPELENGASPFTMQ